MSGRKHLYCDLSSRYRGDPTLARELARVETARRRAEREALIADTRSAVRNLLRRIPAGLGGRATGLAQRLVSAMGPDAEAAAPHRPTEDAAAVARELDAELARAGEPAQERARFRAELAAASGPHASLQHAVAGLRSMLEASRQVQAVTIDGRELEDVLLDVDYWTNGALRSADETLTDVQARLASDRGPEALDAVAAALPGIETVIASAVGEARHQAIMAQARRDLGVVVADAFAKLGFSVTVNDYEGRDARSSFLVKAIGPLASDVTVQVNQGTERNSVAVTLHSYDANEKPEHITRQRLQALVDAFGQAGVKIAGAQTLDVPADPALHDAAALVSDRSTA